MNLEKCRLRVSYLRFQLTKDGIKPGKDKLKAVAQAPAPASVREVQQFLGFSNFFRNHKRNYAHVAAPLTALTRKAGPLLADAMKSFRELQSFLMSEQS